MSSTVTLSQVQKVFPAADGRKPVVALHDLSLDLPAGQSLAVVGPSGAGKTTLLQIVAGLDRPSQGAVVINGQNIAKLNDKALSRFRNQTIGFIFQFFNLQPYFTAHENVAFPMLLAGQSKARAMRRARELLAQVGLEDRAAHLPSDLSGGEMQRVAIARALVNDPRLILADEPTANLDGKNAASILQLLKQVAGQGVSIMVITHDPRISQQFDHVLRLQKGKIV